MNLTNQQYADCSVLPCNLRTDTLLHVPVQPVIVLHTLSSKCHIHLGPQIFVKAESAKQGNGDMISPALPPAFSPTISTACTKYSCLYFRIPDNGFLSLTQEQNFAWTVLLDTKLLAHSFLLITGYVFIIKAKFLGIVQSEHKNYHSDCFMTYYPGIRL